MTRLSDKAFAIMAICEKTKKPFGITVDYIGPRRYKFVWAFKIDKDKAHREGYDKHTVTGCVEPIKTIQVAYTVVANNSISVDAARLSVIMEKESSLAHHADKLENYLQ